MKCNSTAKDDFEAMSLNNFWAKHLHIYKNGGSVAIPFFHFHRHIYGKVDFQHM